MEALDVGRYIISGFEESEKIETWEKRTVIYVMNNWGYLKRILVKKLRKMGRSPIEADDIIAELVEYFYKNPDYDISLCKEEHLMSLEEYVKVKANILLKRYAGIKQKERNRTVEIDRNVSYKDNSDTLDLLSVFNSGIVIDIDNYYVDKEYLRKVCDSIGIRRYECGVDLFIVMYVRLYTLEKGKSRVYETLAGILGCNLSRLKVTDLFREVVRVTSNLGIEESLEVIGDYLYGKHDIINKLNVIMNTDI